MRALDFLLETRVSIVRLNLMKMLISGVTESTRHGGALIVVFANVRWLGLVLCLLHRKTLCTAVGKGTYQRCTVCPKILQ